MNNICLVVVIIVNCGVCNSCGILSLWNIFTGIIFGLIFYVPAKGGGVSESIKAEKHLKFSDSYNKHHCASRSLFLYWRQTRFFTKDSSVVFLSMDQEPITVARLFAIYIRNCIAFRFCSHVNDFFLYRNILRHGG